MAHYITKSFSYLWTIVFLSTFFYGCTSEPKYTIQGELKKWHKIELLFDGPLSGEMDSINPFLNYRLDVSFTQNGETFIVPGFYAADDNAGETSGETGDKWMVRFAPNKTGIWHFKVSFKKGDAIAVSNNSDGASSAGSLDGLEGDFTVTDSDKSGIDNRAKGRLNYVGDHYLKFEESDTYFIKLGVDAPENLLAFNDFDVSTNVFGLRKTWEPHKGDYNQDADDLLWQEGKGKNLFGAIDYLASEKMNVFSFLTFNVDGDDRNIFPYRLKVSEDDYTAYANIKENKGAWQTMFHKTRFDISKMEQWERIFEYGDRKGMFLHFKTHETETDHLMDKGTFGVEGKLYYRELIARFGHHLALNWNIGEENNQPIAEVKKVADYISDLDPYNHHIVVHTFPNEDYRYSELVSYTHLTLPTIYS